MTTRKDAQDQPKKDPKAPYQSPPNAPSGGSAAVDGTPSGAFPPVGAPEPLETAGIGPPPGAFAANAAGGGPGNVAPLRPAANVPFGGEIVVKLKPAAVRGITQSIPTRISAASAPLAPTTFGIPAIDAVLSDLGVTSIAKVHAIVAQPEGPRPLGFAAGADAFAGAAPQAEGDATANLSRGLDATFRVRLGAAEANVGDAVERLNALEEVEYAEPVEVMFASQIPNDPRFPSQWGLNKIRAVEAWDRTLGDPAVIVAVVDTGVDLSHPDLASNLLQGGDFVNVNPAFPPQPGWVWAGDFLSRDNIPQDDQGHGTHVAGIVAAITNNGQGVAGVAGRCRILPVRVMTKIRNPATGQENGSGLSPDIADGIRFAADSGAHVINCSLGGGFTAVIRDAVAYAIAQGCLIVAAMGNENTSTPSYPAAYPGVFAVGAITPAEQRADPSNTGFWGSNVGPHISAVAPGVNIWSTYPSPTLYTQLSGTSMACPMVAGVAALAKSLNPALTGTDLFTLLRSTARLIGGSPNTHFGFGLVDAKAALDAVAFSPSPVSGPSAATNGTPRYDANRAQGRGVPLTPSGQDIVHFRENALARLDNASGKDLPESGTRRERVLVRYYQAMINELLHSDA